MPHALTNLISHGKKNLSGVIVAVHFVSGLRFVMEANPKEPSSVVWLDTELFGPLPLPADPALRSDTEAILARARALASRSKANETLRSYRTAWTQWCGWCELMGYQPLGGDAMAVGMFLAHLSRTKSLATVRTRLAAWRPPIGCRSSAQLPKRVRSPTCSKDSSENKASNRSNRQRPCSRNVLKRVLGIYAKDTATHRRDKAILLIGFASALRRSEIVALDVADVDSVPQGVLLHLARSKTDQHGKGELIAIHRGTDSEFCAVTALERWIELRGRKPGPLFTRLHKGGRMTR